MNKTKIKKILSIILSITMILTFFSNVVFAQSENSYNISNFSYENIDFTVIAQDTKNERIVTVEYEDNEIMAIFDNKTNIITIISDNLAIGNVTVDLKQLNTNNIVSRLITTETDKWFNYTWYRNTDSAYGDYYWRLDNPNRNPVRKNFFTQIGDHNNYYAERFKDCVTNMVNYQNECQKILGFGAALTVASTIAAAIAAGTGGIGAPLMACIVAVLTSLQYTLNAQTPYYHAFEWRYNADMYYDMVI